MTDRITCAVGAVLVALMSVAPRAVAQTADKWILTGEAGVAVPGKQLHQITKVGFGGLLDVAYAVQPHLAVDAFGDYGNLEGRTVPGTAVLGPSIQTANFGVGLQAGALPNSAQRFSLIGRVGVGGSRLSSATFIPFGDTAPISFRHTYPAAALGMEAGVRLAAGVRAYAGTNLFWTFVKKDDTSTLVSLDPGAIQPFAKAWSVPVTAGLSVRL